MSGNQELEVANRQQSSTPLRVVRHGAPLLNRCHRTGCDRSSGYTLIELLIVIALLGLAAAVVVPQFSGTSNLRVQAATREVIADLSFAQQDALAHQEYRRVHFYEDGSGYCIARVNGPSDSDISDLIFDPFAASGEGGYVVDFTTDPRFDGVTITDVSIDGSNQYIVFDSLGGTVRTGNLPGIGGTIDLEAGGNEFRVTISPFTGKLTVQRVN